MSNSFYNAGSFPATGAPGTSASMRAELALIAAGFDKLPTLAGNGNKLVTINAGGTALTVLTPPSGDLVGTTAPQTLTNKTFGDNPTFSAGTANGVAYLNGSKVLTTGSALTFDGTNLGVGIASPANTYSRNVQIDGSASAGLRFTSTSYTAGFDVVLSAGDAYLLNRNNTSLIFGTNATERARITSGGTFQTSLDASIYGVTVGRGAGAVATNTAVGASALAANTTGTSNTAFGNSAFASNTEGFSSTAVGSLALTLNTTGNSNTGIGQNALGSNTTGSNNVSVGTASMLTNSTGASNTALGRSALRLNTTGSFNTVVGMDALRSNTTASENTAVGYQAGYNNTTGPGGTFLGYQAGYNATTGAYNCFVGLQSGISVTTGTRNTILGGYSGNNGGLDIRTASNFIVLSDGDGNARGVFNSSGDYLIGATDATTSLGGNTLAASKMHLASNSQAGSNSTAFSAQKTALFIDSYSGGTNTENAKSGLLINNYEGLASVPGVMARFYKERFPSAPVRVFEVNSVGNIGLGDTDASTSGNGITFPATQNASSNGNTLDDYEEGVWTPVYTGNGVSPTYSEQTGRYIKIGQMVYISFRLVITASSGGSGALRVAGLPFTSSATGSNPGFIALNFSYGWNTAETILTFIPSSGSTSLDAYTQYAANNSNTQTTVAAINAGSTIYIIAGGCYQAAA